MLGWINDCVEKLVVEKFGLAAWHLVKQKAACDVDDNSFFKLDHYSDQSTVDLVASASEVSGLTIDQIYEVFGEFFVHYIRNEGYDNLLCCQGSTLKDWMSNINAIHVHLQSTFPKKMIMPQFWVEDDVESQGGALLLHYHSRRGNFLAPLAKGLVAEIAKFQFELDIDMTRTATQDVDGAKFTTWLVTTKDHKDMWKLRNKEGGRNGLKNAPTTFKCPFSGMTGKVPSITRMASLAAANAGPPAHLRGNEDDSSDNATGSNSGPIGCPLSDSDDEDSSHPQDHTRRPAGGCPHAAKASKSSSSGGCPHAAGSTSMVTKSEDLSASLSQLDVSNKVDDAVASTKKMKMRSNSAATLGTASMSSDGSSGSSLASGDSGSSDTSNGVKEVGISATLAKSIFPYHMILDKNFTILQVGASVESVLQLEDESEVIGHQIGDIMEVTQPMGMEWSSKWMRLMEQQPFDVTPVVQDHLRFKVTAVSMAATGNHDDPSSRSNTMLIMHPFANTMLELRDMGLTISDLPAHGCHRNAVFLREHLSTQMNNALKMEKLSRNLEKERDLLHSLLPAHAAEGLRTGTTVEPRLHNDVTLFFSDIVGFTNICDQIYPWEVISMLNRLYMVMDFLAERFNIYKIETIGDAYVCCSGLPGKDPNHARNVANFALAVQHCCKLVVSPLDDTTPIELRIGLHTGACASGVVGKTNPRYCVFGDTVNTAARHESSGEAGKIHTSKHTMRALQHHKGFGLEKRGLVPMKGKGDLLTYWLDSSDSVNAGVLQGLEVEVTNLLKTTNFFTGTTCKMKRANSNNILKAAMELHDFSDGELSSCSSSSESEDDGDVSGLELLLGADNKGSLPNSFVSNSETVPGRQALDDGGRTSSCTSSSHAKSKVDKESLGSKRGQAKEGGIPPAVGWVESMYFL